MFSSSTISSPLTTLNSDPLACVTITDSYCPFRYPFLFYELAVNYEADPWIRRLGLAHIESFREKGEFDASSNPIRFLVRHPKSLTEIQSGADAPRLPYTVHQPTDVASVVALSPDGRLLVYGTLTGTVTLVNASTMQVSITSFSLVHSLSSNAY